ncbi:10472_t:CDS:2 [Entrophospora sp. SA101]|nr:10472_t:CDS:2 [Entrophospora sp. SA101]
MKKKSLSSVLYYKKKNTEVDEPRKIPFWKESEIQESEISNNDNLL